MKIWLDTDIGDDIDDALALEALLKNEDVELLGISTVFKNAPLRAMLAQKMVALSGKNVPVYAGASVPLRGLRKTNHGEIYNQYGVELEPVDPLFYQQSASACASEKMLQALAENHGAAVLAIGPLTNLGIASRLDKQSILASHPIYFMGGDYKRGRSEWNLLCDVESAATLFSSRLNLYAIGLEETEKTKLTAAEEKRLRGSGQDPLAAYRETLVGRFKQSTHWEITPHDCLAAYAMLHPSLWEKGDPEILVEGVDAMLKLHPGEKVKYLSSFSRGDFLSWLLESLK